MLSSTGRWLRNADAEVAAQRVAGVVPVLHDQRAVQPVLMPQLRCPLGSERLVAGENLHRIAGDQVQHQEAQHRDPDRMAPRQRA